MSMIKLNILEVVVTLNASLKYIPLQQRHRQGDGRPRDMEAPQRSILSPDYSIFSMHISHRYTGLYIDVKLLI